MAEYKSDLVGANAYAQGLWDENIVLRWRSNEERNTIVTAATKVFDDEIARFPGVEPDLQVYKKRVQKELKGFVPFFIIAIVIQFFIWKLLEWLWQNWKQAQPTIIKEE